MHRTEMHPLFRRLAPVLLLLPALSGCAAAAVAVPVMTAAGVLTERNRNDEAAAEPGAESAVILTELAELPPPDTAHLGADDPWAQFTTFALTRHEARQAGEPVQSMMLAKDSALRLDPDHLPCTQRETAVLIDLDPANGAFVPNSRLRAYTGLPAHLARLRESGLVVLWVSQLDANRIEQVARVLRDSGLDPTGRDPILLALKPGDRKQVIREQANEAVCVIAMAGDEHSDFDELFDYLRNPNDAFRFDHLIGAGWFLVPEVVSEPAAPNAASAVAPPREDGGG
ncbi:MAG TPA: hypothetical protein VKY80_12375 [Croceibacterium sp.]|nr:hypothetical protein [Croceibacterium sp.]